MLYSVGAIQTTGNGVTGCVLMRMRLGNFPLPTKYLVHPTGIYSTYTNRNIKLRPNGDCVISILGHRAKMSDSSVKRLCLEASSKMGFGMPSSSQQEPTPAAGVGKYIIGSLNTDGYSFSKNPVVHTSLDAAEAEAERLTNTVAEKKFVVVKLISQFEAKKVIKTQF
jgi:hypothetical protein